MEAPFKRYLNDFYRSYLNQQGMTFLKKYYTNELMFEDNKRQRYRSPAEMTELEDDVKKQSEALTREFVDELEAEGIVTPQNFEDNSTHAELILERYLKRLEEYLRGLR